jgi:hypothetical protein
MMVFGDAISFRMPEVVRPSRLEIGQENGALNPGQPRQPPSYFQLHSTSILPAHPV